MKTMTFNCHKAAQKLQLSTIARFFQMNVPLSWSDYVILKSDHLESVLKYKCEDKLAYIFSYGCITFVNFNLDETCVLVQTLESMGSKIDYEMFSKYFESHTVEVDEQCMCTLWKSDEEQIPYKEHVTEIMSVVLAKSVELYRLELSSAELLDKAERYIEYLKKGHLRANTKKLAAIISAILRFEYESIESIKIYDRPSLLNNRNAARRGYEKFADYFELYDRFDVVQSKISDLRGIVEKYSELSYKSSETRLLWLEIFLLSLFPVFHIIQHLAYVMGVKSIFKYIF